MFDPDRNYRRMIAGSADLTKSTFDESKVNRDDIGQFADKAGGNSGENTDGNSGEGMAERWDGVSGEAGEHFTDMIARRNAAAEAGDDLLAEALQQHIDLRIESQTLAFEMDQKFEGPQLTDLEQGALNTYTSNAYKKINQGLRDGNPPASRAKMIERLDGAISGERLVEDVTLYRGIVGSRGDSWQAGQTISDAAFQSTSYSRDEALTFATRSPRHNTMFEITNTRGMNALNVSPDRYPSKLFSNEVVLARNQGFRVTGTRIDKYTMFSGETRDITVVEMEPL